MQLQRQSIISTLHDVFAARPWAHAVWLGGSDANGRTDRFSDIDFIVVVDDERVEEAFSVAAAAMETLSPIDLQWRVPSPTWHGHEQTFYRLRDADPHHMIDFIPMKRSTPPGNRFLDRERHGTPIVLFDRASFCVPVPMDAPSIDQKRHARLERLRATFPMFQPLITRAVARGQPTDAAYWYMQLTLLPTVEVLRMLHCPDRFDFGMRYLKDDLPAPIYAQLCELSFPASLQGVLTCRERAESLFDNAVRALDARKNPA